MSMGTIHTYLTYERISGNRLTVGDLMHRISRYDIRSVLPIVALLNNAFTLGKARPSGASQAGLADVFFTDLAFRKRIEDARISGPETDPVIFHRHQQLVLMRLALLACPTEGAEKWDSTALQSFGEAALIASDLIQGAGYLQDDFAKKETSAKTDSDWQQWMADFLSVSELSIDEDPAPQLGRAAALWLEILSDSQLWASEKSLANIDTVFSDKYGVSIKELFFVATAIFSVCVSYDPSSIQASGNLVINTETFLGTSKFSKENLDAALGVMSITLERMSQQLLYQPSQSALSDFSLFRRYPIVRMGDRRLLCLDRGFLMKFMMGGIYWLLHDALPNESQQGFFRAFFGRMYATYLNRLFEDVYGGYKSQLLARQYNPEVKFHDGSELCDGVIDETGDTLVIMEYKGALLTTRAKYSGDLIALRKEIDAKFVHGRDDKKKGAAQLAHSIKKMTERYKIRLLGLEDVTKIRRIYPVLVSYDAAMTGVLVPRYLSDAFQSLLSFPIPSGFPEIRPLVVLTTQDVEMYCALHNRPPLAQVLEGFIEAGGSGDHPNARLNDYLVARREQRNMPPTYYGKAYTKLFDDVKTEFFASDVPAEFSVPEIDEVDATEDIRENNVS